MFFGQFDGLVRTPGIDDQYFIGTFLGILDNIDDVVFFVLVKIKMASELTSSVPFLYKISRLLAYIIL